MKGVTKNCLCVTPEVTNKHISVTPEGLWISTSFYKTIKTRRGAIRIYSLIKIQHNSTRTTQRKKNNIKRIVL